MAPFEISGDEEIGIIQAALRGFWTIEIFEAFERAMLAKSARMKSLHSVYALFSDCTEFPVQASDVVHLFQRIEGPESVGGPTAILVGSALVKLQAERVLTDPAIRAFTDRQRAEAWLMETLEARRRER